MMHYGEEKCGHRDGNFRVDQQEWIWRSLQGSIRREQRKWVRGALTDAFVAFLDASWRGTDALKRHQEEEVPAQAYADMRSNLTRLRLLASAPVVAAGEELLRSQRAAMTAEEGKVKAALEQCSVDRRKVVEAGKQEMGLG